MSEHSELKKDELLRQEYSNEKYIAGGLLYGHPHDSLYLEFGGGDDEFDVLLRDDEAATIIWLLGGILYSDLMGKRVGHERD